MSLELGELIPLTERGELGPRRSGACTSSTFDLPTALDYRIDVARGESIRGPAERTLVGEACASAGLRVLATALVNNELPNAICTYFMTVAASYLAVL